jgi:hypothetical protein
VHRIAHIVLATLSLLASTTGSARANEQHYIFVTSETHLGNLGGLSGADDLCASHAASGTLTGSLGLEWRALISIHGVVDAKDRVAWSKPVYDVAGNLATNDPSSWPWVRDGTSTIGVNEDGGDPPDSYVWTGSNENGMSVGPGNDCNGWTDSTDTFSGWSGENGRFDSPVWIDSFSSECDVTWFSLYCVSEVDELLFADGFESGDTTAWSGSQ